MGLHSRGKGLRAPFCHCFRWRRTDQRRLVLEGTDQRRLVLEGTDQRRLVLEGTDQRRLCRIES
jgi:hypothetical protein